MIVKGDNGIQLRMTLLEDEQPIDLTGMVLKVIFKNGDYRTEKLAEPVGDPLEGVCEVKITSDDVAEAGILQFQVRAENIGGGRFSSEIENITVSEGL